MPNYRKFIESYITLNFFQLNYQNKKKRKENIMDILFHSCTQTFDIFPGQRTPLAISKRL